MRHVVLCCSRLVQETRTRNLLQTKQRELTLKLKKARVIILIRDTSSCPVLHIYQVSSKYSKGYSSNRADKKFYADADVDADTIRSKNSMSPTLRLWGHNNAKAYVASFFLLHSPNIFQDRLYQFMAGRLSYLCLWTDLLPI